MAEHLLATLRRRANHEGLVRVRDAVLVADLQCDAHTIYSGLAKLAETGAIDLLSPPPFIVVKLRMWPGDGSEMSGSDKNAYSYSKQLFDNKAFKADSYRPDELAADDGLLQEILETLGEEDPASFRKAVEHYAPHVIRLALERVRRAKNIRKNRTALFRHLLPRIAKNALEDN
jgi:hypothetical protein